jgi:hypothetical protein
MYYRVLSFVSCMLRWSRIDVDGRPRRQSGRRGTAQGMPTQSRRAAAPTQKTGTRPSRMLKHCPLTPNGLPQCLSLALSRRCRTSHYIPYHRRAVDAAQYLRPWSATAQYCLHALRRRGDTRNRDDKFWKPTSIQQCPVVLPMPCMNAQTSMIRIAMYVHDDGLYHQARRIRLKAYNYLRIKLMWTSSFRCGHRFSWMRSA